jgi:hypothetical protein
VNSGNDDLEPVKVRRPAAREAEAGARPSLPHNLNRVRHA